MPDGEPPPRKVVVAVLAAMGAVFGGGYGVVRPLLPRTPTAAGVAYGLLVSNLVERGTHSLARAFRRELPRSGPRLATIPLSKRGLLMATSFMRPALVVAWAEELVARRPSH